MLSSSRVVIALAIAAGCDAGARTPAAATVTLTSVAFAEDCGGTPPSQPPIMPAPKHAAAAGSSYQPPAAEAMAARAPDDAGYAPVQRRCEQTSMQLSVAAKQDSEIRIKSVEVFDDKGKSLGKLTSKTPTRWSAAQSVYQPWDEKVGAGQTALVSYVLQQPTFLAGWHERDRMFTVKVIASVGGVDQPLQKTVMVVGQPPPVAT